MMMMTCINNNFLNAWCNLKNRVKKPIQLKNVDVNSADKIWSKKGKGWKVPSLMPIRVQRKLHEQSKRSINQMHYQQESSL